MIQTKEAALQALQSLEQALKEIGKHENKGMNIFSAVGMSRQEVRHSAFFAWLLTPFAPDVQHGLGNSFLKRWLECLFTHPNADVPEPDLKSNREILALAGISSMDGLALLLAANDVVVDTERVILSAESRIDILITSKSAQTVIAIENKVGTSTHDEQLSRYERDEVNGNRAWAGWKKIFVYLTPFGDHPYEYRAEEGKPVYNDTWCVCSYATILNILRETKASLGKSRTHTKLKLLIEDYIDMVNSKILQKDGELRALCRRISRQYRDELELLMMYTKDNLADVLNICRTWLKEHTDILLLNETESRLEFVTRKINDFFREELQAERTPYPVCVRIAAMKGDIDITLFLENASGGQSEWTQKQSDFAAACNSSTSGKNKYCSLMREILLPEDARQGELTEEHKSSIERGLSTFWEKMQLVEERMDEISG